jgi:hypothetical protein
MYFQINIDSLGLGDNKSFELESMPPDRLREVFANHNDNYNDSNMNMP